MLDLKKAFLDTIILHFCDRSPFFSLRNIGVQTKKYWFFFCASISNLSLSKQVWIQRRAPLYKMLLYIQYGYVFPWNEEIQWDRFPNNCTLVFSVWCGVFVSLVCSKCCIVFFWRSVWWRVLPECRFNLRPVILQVRMQSPVLFSILFYVLHMWCVFCVVFSLCVCISVFFGGVEFAVQNHSRCRGQGDPDLRGKWAQPS